MRRLSTATLPAAHGRLAPKGRSRALLAVALGAMALLLLAPGRSARAATPAGDDASKGQVDVVKVSGLLDPVLADLVVRSVDRAEDDGSVALVLQLNSSGSVISDGRLVQLAERLHGAAVPVAIWVGPSGAKAKGGSAELLGAVSVVGVAPGSTVGDTGEPAVPSRLQRDAWRRHAAELRDHTFDSDQARRAGIATVEAPVIVDMVGRLPGVESHIEQEPEPHRVADVTPVFSQLPVTSQLMHTVASPAAAYLLVVIGLALVVFELFTAGVGIAGLVGAGAFALGSYGLWVLPTRWWAFALLLLAFLAYAVDVQTGVPRFWTAVGTVSLVVASLLLFHGMWVGWLPSAVGVVGTTFFMLSGMPAMVRTRFSTPSIDRAWMVGEEGEAVDGIDPDGVVRVAGGLWNARSGEGAAVALGDRVRVTGVAGLVLVVEPVEGGGAAREREA